jgi:hypothetical protein
MQFITAAAHYLGEVLERLYTIRNTGAFAKCALVLCIESDQLYMEQVMFSVFSTMGTKLHPSKKKTTVVQEFMANEAAILKRFLFQKKIKRTQMVKQFN